MGENSEFMKICGEQSISPDDWSSKLLHISSSLTIPLNLKKKTENSWFQFVQSGD